MTPAGPQVSGEDPGGSMSAGELQRLVPATSSCAWLNTAASAPGLTPVVEALASALGAVGNGSRS